MAIDKQQRMKAIVYDRYGPPEVLRIEELEKPVPMENEVLIRIRAVEATKADCELRSFKYQVKWFWLPLRLGMGITKPRNRVLGTYFAGEVESCGAGVTQFHPGMKVFGCGRLRMGAYAEYACYPASYTIAEMPANTGFAEAASSLLGGLNALHFLNLGKLCQGERILINGAGGSIGLFAVQIARARGAVVTAVDKPEKEDLLRRAGADHFIDYTKKPFWEHGEHYDVIFNIVAKVTLTQCAKSLARGGCYLMGNPRFPDMLRSAFFGRRSGSKAHFLFAGEMLPELETLKSMIEDGTVNPIVDRTLPFEKVADAHRLVEQEQRLGMIVLVPNEQERV
jgi:NADPH:quinone reductase-like Zn-dependent oxidoreductase